MLGGDIPVPFQLAGRDSMVAGELSAPEKEDAPLHEARRPQKEQGKRGGCSHDEKGGEAKNSFPEECAHKEAGYGEEVRACNDGPISD